MADYDVIIIGAGPGGIFSAYELVNKKPGIRVAVFESGKPLERGCQLQVTALANRVRPLFADATETKDSIDV